MSDSPEPAPSPAALSADAILLRRISPRQVTSDGAGGTRPFSGAFKLKKGEPLSVYVEGLVEQLGLDFRAPLVGHNEYGLVSFTAGLVRELGLDVALDPDPDDDVLGDAHAAVSGPMTDKACGRLAKECVKRVWPF